MADIKKEDVLSMVGFILGVFVVMSVILGIVYLVKKENFGNKHNDKHHNENRLRHEGLFGLLSDKCDGKVVLTNQCVMDSHEKLSKIKKNLLEDLNKDPSNELLLSKLKVIDSHLGTHLCKGLSGIQSQVAFFKKNKTQKNEKFGGAIGQPNSLLQMMGPA